jgi:hypothetical protein
MRISIGTGRVHALLDRAQQLRLQAHLHLGNLVKQQRAAVGLLELADAPCHCAGEGSFLVAEQFGFEQRFRDRGAIDADERLFGPGRPGVNIARQYFLAGAGFAGNQHRGVAAGDLLRELDDASHGVIAIDQLARIFGDGGQHGGNQFRVGRQRDILLGAGMDRGNRGARIGGGAASNDRRVNVLGFEPGDEVADVDRDIDHQKIRAAPGAQHRKRLGDIGGVSDRRALIHRDLGRGGELAVERAND